MTKDEIIEMAKQSGWSGIYTQWAEPTGEADWSPYKVSLTVPVTIEQIEAFAKLVAEKEREACNAICLDTYEWAENLLDQDEKHFAGRMRAAQDIGNAIRAREQA